MKMFKYLLPLLLLSVTASQAFSLGSLFSSEETEEQEFADDEEIDDIEEEEDMDEEEEEEEEEEESLEDEGTKGKSFEFSITLNALNYLLICS